MELFISEFSGETQQKILDKMKKEYFSTGKYVKDQMSVSPNILSSLILSAGDALTAASADDGNPEKLLKVVQVIADDVLKAKGLPAITTLIPVATAAIPVVAPLMAMHTLYSVTMLQQFSAMDKKLDEIKSSIDKMMARQEVTNVAELFTAVHIVDEIYLQYGQAGMFSTDMLIRLALAERDAMRLSRRYEMLEDFTLNNEDTNSYSGSDTFCAMLSFFLNLRVKYLRTCVDIQENPQFVQRSAEDFAALLKNSINLWDRLLRKSEKMEEDIERLQNKNAGVLERFTQTQQKELLRKKDEYAALMKKERVILNDFNKIIHIAKQMSENTNSQTLPTLVYWKDGDGEHCIATNELVLDVVS